VVANTLILLRLEPELSKWYPHMKQEEIKYQCDILYAGAILHDVLEDSYTTPSNLQSMGLDEEVITIVKILTKKRKGQKNICDSEKYFANILTNWKATLIKIADRENNCSTMEVFKEERMKRYVYETIEYFYPLCSKAKILYPELYNAIIIMENSIVAICETIASLLNIPKIIADEEEDYERTFQFIEEYSRNQSPNMHKALYLAKDLHAGQMRTSGDPFIIHPLRVCSYLISIGIDDDILCAAVLLHEVPKMCPEKIEEVRSHDLDGEVLELIKKIPKREWISQEEYYDGLKENWRAIIGRAANRAHTCTGLANLSYEEKKDYIQETREYLVPMCEYAVTLYPQYVNQIDIMVHHSTAICNIVEALVKKQSSLDMEAN
jgi:GTP pyrophosphokinase